MNIYTDGSCLGNPGPGGWAVVWTPELHTSGGVIETTNNRMELHAIWKALQLSRGKDSSLTIYSDSLWAVNCITRRWRPTKNLDLLQKIWDEERKLTFSPMYLWIKAHNGDPLNELADRLAKEAAQEIRSINARV